MHVWSTVSRRQLLRSFVFDFLHFILLMVLFTGFVSFYPVRSRIARHFRRE
jgi:hypothetical protein